MPIFIILDYLDIPLLHGWVLDPQDKITADTIQNQSYNQIINTLVEYRTLLDRTIGSYKSSKLSKKGKSEIEMKGDGSEMKGDVLVLIAEEPIINGEEIPAALEESPGEYDSKDMANSKIQADNDELDSVNSDTKDLADSSSYVIINSSSDHIEAPNSEFETSLIDHDLLTDNKDNLTEIQTHDTTEKGILESEIIPNSTDPNGIINNIPPVPSERIISEKYTTEELKNDLSEEDLKLFREGEIIEAFLALTASQLTYLG